MRRHRLVTILALALCALAPGRGEARKFLDSINDADRAILDDLHNGSVVEARPFRANGNAGDLWEVWIEHNGHRRHALLKPRPDGDRDGWARTPMEVAMYKLNRILGMDLVPPAAYRRWLWLPNGVYVHEGALIHFMDDAHLAERAARDLWHPRQEAFSSDTRILSSLGRDADHENGRNIIRGQHWADGKYRVAKIDWEGCRRPGAYVNMEHSSATWGPVTRFNPHTVARLRELSFNDLKADLGEYLSDGEINDVLGIRDGILGYVERQRQQRGETVFLSDAEIAYDGRLRLKRRATAKELAKFESKMRKKGVQVEYVSPSSLKGALGKTVLTPSGITVRLLRGKRRPRFAILVEELVHVNQLRTMARRVGSFDALHAELMRDPARSRLLRDSMEAYAKGKLRQTTKRPKELSKLRRVGQRHARLAAARGIQVPRQLWRARVPGLQVAAPVASARAPARRP